MNNKIFKILQKSSPLLARKVSQDENAMAYIGVLEEERSKYLVQECVKELLIAFPLLKIEEL